MFSRIRPYLFLGLTLLLLSCSESSGLFGSKPSPCSLITVADAEQALGEPVQEGALTEPTICLFKARRNEGNTVTVQLDDAPSKDRRTWFNKERLRRDSQLIPGLGDGAVRIDSSPTLSRLTFMHDDTFVTVIVSSARQKQLGESVTHLARAVAGRYGASLTATLSSSPFASTSPSGRGTQAEAVTVPTEPVTLTQTFPAPSGPQVGSKKVTSLDPANLVGTWHTHFTQGTTQHDMLLVIQPNLKWSLSSMMQFDGILNAEAGLWSLERANTFKGLGWKGTYRKTAPNTFASTGSVQATWTKLSIDQHPSRIPAELWKLRREATSVPVFQLKTVDPDLVGQWEGSGTYAGGAAAFVWGIKSSAATDLLIVNTLRGSVQNKDGLPQLRPVQKQQQRVSVIAFHDRGFTTTDGKTNLRWTKFQSEPTDDRQL
ncbi:MAG: hypothetical protein A4E19_17905 [Nitrospira sp. SG-bin1]|nr:MAG: hypothetical protein A4E19_17905 [Nitrospira sp. SG-bin1]